MKLPNLTPEDIKEAKALYEEFFRTTSQSNPTDVNTTQKKRFFEKHGLERLIIMQRCRKKGSEKFPFVVRSDDEQI